MIKKVSILLSLIFIMTFLTDTQSAEIIIQAPTEQCSAPLIDLKINPQTGNVIATSNSMGTCGSSNSGEITSFFINENLINVTVNEGVPIDVHWSSVNTISCTAGGTLSAWKILDDRLPSSGSRSISTDGLINGNYTLSLNCLTGQNIISASSDLIVTIQNSSADICSNRQPISVNRARSIVFNTNDDARFFKNVFGAFPGSGNSKQIIMANDQYAAMEFVTGSNIAPSSLYGIQAVTMQPLPANTTTSSRALKMWSISRCPGDFRKHVIDTENGPGCLKGGTSSFSAQGTFTFGGSNYINDTNVCALEENTVYFLNLLYTDQELPESELEHNELENRCPTLFCGHGMQSQGRGF